MRCSFDWIWSGVQGVQIACTIAQAQEFAWQCIHSGIDRPPQRRQGQAAPESHRRLSRQRRQGQHPQRLRGLWKISPPRGCGAVSKRTCLPGQKEHAISVQHARALAGAHACNAAHVERRHACAIAGAHVARRRRGFEENVIAWTEGTRDQCAACACTHRRMRACRAAACACNRSRACVHVDARMRACRAAAARFRRERTRLDRRNT
jgi:hypothetical protein